MKYLHYYVLKEYIKQEIEATCVKFVSFIRLGEIFVFFSKKDR